MGYFYSAIESGREKMTAMTELLTKNGVAEEVAREFVELLGDLMNEKIEDMRRDLRDEIQERGVYSSDW